MIFARLSTPRGSKLNILMLYREFEWHALDKLVGMAYQKYMVILMLISFSSTLFATLKIPMNSLTKNCFCFTTYMRMWIYFGLAGI